MNIEVNKHLFAVCCGLYATGYPLGDDKDDEKNQLTEKIVSVRFPGKVYEFFPFAKTDQCDVNPYWPRGSDISAACFFLEKPISIFIDFLKSCGSNECDNPGYIDWIADLPNVIKMIEVTEEFPNLFNRFEFIIAGKKNEIQQKLDSTVKLLTDYGFINDVIIKFAPTLLQSTDYAFVDDRLYVIAREYSETAVLHEYLHPIINEFHPQLEKIIELYGIEKFVNPSKMIKIGYMNDYSIQSKCNALDNCIIMGLVGAMATSINVKDYCMMIAEMGFLFVPQIIKYAEKYKPTKDNLLDFITGALSN